MRIGFEAFPMQEKPSGVGKYVLSIIEDISNQLPDAEFFAYSNRKIGLPIHLKHKIEKREQTTGLEGKLPGMIWLKFFLNQYIKKDHLDYYISATGFFPKLPRSVKRIAIIHDLNYRLVPETMGKMYYLSHLIYFKKDVKSSEFVITNTQGTADKLYQFLQKKTDEIINPPISSQFYKRSDEEILSVLKKHRLDPSKKYLLFVGNLEPRKNLEFTLNHFIDLVKSNRVINTQLLVVGLKGWRDKRIQQLIDQYSEYVKVLGYVEEADLPALYSGAELFVFPSLYEGFGMPVREALFCETKVLTSDLPELREAGVVATGDMINYINPYNGNDFKNSICQLLQAENMNSPVEKLNQNLKKLILFLNRK